MGTTVLSILITAIFIVVIAAIVYFYFKKKKVEHEANHPSAPYGDDLPDPHDRKPKKV